MVVPHEKMIMRSLNNEDQNAFVTDDVKGFPTWIGLRKFGGKFKNILIEFEPELERDARGRNKTILKFKD